MNDKLKIEVEGKEVEFGPEEVKQLLSEKATSQEILQQVTPALQAAEKYGIDPATYIKQAEGAFGVVTDLIDKGVIDRTGKLIEQVHKSTGDDPKKGDDLKKVDDPKKETSVPDIVANVLEQVKELVKPLTGKLQEIEETQGGMIRTELEGRIQKQYPGLGHKDLKEIFARAMQDRNKDLWAHAKEVDAETGQEKAKLVEEELKKLGVDVEKIKTLNTIKTQLNTGGAGGLFQGTKISFNPKKGEKSVKPVDATRAYFDALKEAG